MNTNEDKKIELTSTNANNESLPTTLVEQELEEVKNVKAGTRLGIMLALF